MIGKNILAFINKQRRKAGKVLGVHSIDPMLPLHVVKGLHVEIHFWRRCDAATLSKTLEALGELEHGIQSVPETFDLEFITTLNIGGERDG